MGMGEFRTYCVQYVAAGVVCGEVALALSGKLSDVHVPHQDYPPPQIAERVPAAGTVTSGNPSVFASEFTLLGFPGLRFHWKPLPVTSSGGPPVNFAATSRRLV